MKISTMVIAAFACAITASIPISLQGPMKVSATVPTPPLGKTGALPSEGTCAQCHSGAATTGTPFLTVVPPITEYAPGNTYTIGVGVEDFGMVRWGFEATVLKDSDNTTAGSITTFVDPHVVALPSGGRIYVCHTTNGITSPNDPTDGTWWGTQDGPVAWGFTWTAPAQGAGPVTFYATMVAANGDDDANSADNTYVTTMTLTEGAPVAVTHTTWGNIKNIYK